MANVFTRSDYAPYLEPGTSDWVEQVSEVRAAEDLRFAKMLTNFTGVANAVRWVDVQRADAPLRLGIDTEDVLRQSVAGMNGASELADAFHALPSADVVLAPLALGDHIDHRLVREAASQAFGDRVVFYEDLPYACRMTKDEISASLSSWLPADLRAWSPASVNMAGRKQQLAMCYPSQIASRMAVEMSLYAERMGGVERFYGGESSVARLELALQGGVA